MAKTPLRCCVGFDQDPGNKMSRMAAINGATTTSNSQSEIFTINFCLQWKMFDNHIITWENIITLIIALNKILLKFN